MVSRREEGGGWMDGMEGMRGDGLLGMRRMWQRMARQ